MDIRTYNSYTTYRLSNGEVRKYPVTKTYKVRADHVQISDEMKAQIIEQHKLGVAATRIATNVGITPNRVRRFLKKMTDTGE